MILGYHYIKRKNYKKNCGIRFVDYPTFDKELRFLLKNKSILKKNDLLKLNYYKGFNLPNNKFLLTFDDGLKDHYYVFKKLKKMGLWGIFFIPTKPYIEKKFIATFFLHYLLSKKKIETIISTSMNLIKKSFIFRKEFNSDLYEKFITNNKYKDIEKLKILFNSLLYFKDDQIKDEFIESLKSNLLPNLSIYDIHLSEDEIKEMDDAGMIIGNHSHSHNYMSDLNYEDQENEVLTSKSFFKKLKLKSPNIYAYPYGKTDTFNHSTVKILKKNDIKLAFTYNDFKYSPAKNLFFNEKYFINRINPDHKNYKNAYDISAIIDK